MEIILSTRNPSKTVQIKEVFAGSKITLLTLDEVQITGEAVENGSTLEENAELKARYAHDHSDGTRWAVADDTGIFISALNGAPGVHSARWAGDVPTEEITRYCLKRLEGATERSAIFRTVVAAVSPEGSARFFVGEVPGTLLSAPRVPPQPKMPYSPLFVPDGETQVWAEMSTEHENAISHRGKAFRKALTFFESLL